MKYMIKKQPSLKKKNIDEFNYFYLYFYVDVQLFSNLSRPNQER